MLGYLFTLLFLLTAYVTPPILFGPLAEYHVEIVVVLLAIVFSIPNVPGSGLGRTAQMLGLAGVGFSIVASIAQSGWLGGAVGSLYGFLIPFCGFLLVAVNCKTRRHLQWIVLLFVAGSIFYMVVGLRDLQAGVSPSPYIYGEGTLRRIRGLGFVNDPNDFAQMMVSLMPAMFLWRKKSAFANLLLIGVPIAVLMVAMYFTHSRGGMLAVMVVVLLAARRKIGVVPAALVSGVLVAGLFASGWSGGRDVSMDAGADRLDLWYDGMETIKAHPLFGIGLNGFADQFGITAHNTIVICASELGVVGLYFWVMLIFSSFRTAIRVGKVGLEAPAARQEEEDTTAPAYLRHGVSAAKPPVPADSTTMAKPPHGWAEETVEETDESVREMARLLLLSLAGFLTAGWFLSRALSMWLFMYCGMVYAVSRMNWSAKELPRDPFGFTAKWCAAVTVGLLLVLYVILRARNFMH